MNRLYKIYSILRITCTIGILVYLSGCATTQPGYRHPAQSITPEQCLVICGDPGVYRFDEMRRLCQCRRGR